VATFLAVPVAHFLHFFLGLRVSAPHTGNRGFFSRRRLSPVLVALRAPAFPAFRAGEERGTASDPASRAITIARMKAAAHSNCVSSGYFSALEP